MSLQYPKLTPFSQNAPSDTQVSYTAQGHTAKETNSLGTQDYGYNAALRLTSVQSTAQGQGSPSLSATYRYDPFGRRIAKTVTEGATSVTTYYQYSDQGLMAEANDQGQMTKAYGWSPQAPWGTNPLWQANVQNGSLTDAATQVHYLHTDHLGTPILATDKQGATSWKAVSEAFGATGTLPESNISMNLRLPGQYFDSETGTHYNFNRDYQPSQGRYIEADPIGLAGGDSNLYGYVIQEPINWQDSEGLGRFRGGGGRGKGERGRTGSSKGTNDPYKHYEQDPTNPNRVISTDANGKDHYHKKPADFDELKKQGRKKQRGEALEELFDWLVPWFLVPNELACGTLDCREDFDPCKK